MDAYWNFMRKVTGDNVTVCKIISIGGGMILAVEIAVIVWVISL